MEKTKFYSEEEDYVNKIEDPVSLRCDWNDYLETNPIWPDQDLFEKAWLERFSKTEDNH